MFEEGKVKADEVQKLKQEVFELTKLIERNQLAWKNSMDNDMGCLPEVYLANEHYLENRRM